MKCWLKEHGVMERGDPMPLCHGPLIRAHLIPRTKIMQVTGSDEVAWDHRAWVPACGGLTGIGGHHGMFDSSRTLRVPYESLPANLIEFAMEIGLLWWLERTYPLARDLHGLQAQ